MTTNEAKDVEMPPNTDSEMVSSTQEKDGEHDAKPDGDDSYVAVKDEAAIVVSMQFLNVWSYSVKVALGCVVSR